MSELNEYEAKLWREHSAVELANFESKLNLGDKSLSDIMPFSSKIDVEKSGIDDDEKRYDE